MIFQIEVSHLLSKLKVFDLNTVIFCLKPSESKLILMTESFQAIYLVAYISNDQTSNLFSDKYFGVELSDLKPLLRLTKAYAREILTFVYDEASNFLTVSLPTQVTLKVVALPYNFVEVENNFIPLVYKLRRESEIIPLLPTVATPILKDFLKLKKHSEELFMAQECAVFTSPTDITVVHFNPQEINSLDTRFRTVSRCKDLNIPSITKFLHYNNPTNKKDTPLLICIYTEFPDIWWSHSTGLTTRIKTLSVDPSEYFYHPYGKTLAKLQQIQDYYSSFHLTQEEVALLYERYKSTCSASQKGVIHLSAINKVMSVFVYNDKAEEIARLQINVSCDKELDLFLNLSNFSTLLPAPKALEIKYLDRMYPCIIRGAWFTSYFMPVIFFDRSHSNV